MHFFQVRGQIVLITRSKGSRSEYESRELGEVEGGGGWRVAGDVEKKGEEIGSQRLSEKCSSKSRGP